MTKQNKNQDHDSQTLERLKQQQLQQKQQNRPGCSIPLHGCFTVIMFSIIICILVNECKRSKIRLDSDRRKYQQTDTVIDAPQLPDNTAVFMKHFNYNH